MTTTNPKPARTLVLAAALLLAPLGALGLGSAGAQSTTHVTLTADAPTDQTLPRTLAVQYYSGDPRTTGHLQGSANVQVGVQTASYHNGQQAGEGRVEVSRGVQGAVDPRAAILAAAPTGAQYAVFTGPQGQPLVVHLTALTAQGPLTAPDAEQ